MSNKIDPLESAKVTSESAAADAQKLADAGKPRAKAPDAPPSTPSPAPAPRAPEKRVMFRVTKQCKASFHGAVHDLKEGKVLDPAGYGGVDALKKRQREGLPIEQVEIEV